MEYTSGIPSPGIYREWAAYATIAGALERRVWTRMSGSLLYPNLIILLIGNPGVGKSMAVNETLALWARSGLFNIAPSGMTKAAFLDQLCEKPKTFQYQGVNCIYNAMLVAAPEFGTLLPEYDTRFLSVLNDVYDCGALASDRTRKDGTLKIDNPHVNIISGTQPKYLGDRFPESAYGQGFTSRIVMVYCGKRVVVDMFKAAMRNENLGNGLAADLAIIGKLVGEFGWESSAQEAVEEWNRTLLDDAPSHPLLQNYNTRRIIHTVKLAMAAAISHSDELVVTLEQFSRAKELLLAAEAVMPEIFKEMASSQDAVEVNEIHEFIFGYCLRYKVEAVPEHKLVHYMVRRIPVNRVSYFIEVMLTSKMMKVSGLNIPGQRKFEPLKLTPYED